MQATEYLVQNNLDNYGIKGAYYLNSIFRLKNILNESKEKKNVLEAGNSFWNISDN